MRKITDHIVNPANDKLTIEVLDGPGQGGASHLYMITGFNTGSNPSRPFTERYGPPAVHSTVLFQNGPINEFGVNGITHEALLAILADRLRSFQAGPFASAYNALALANINAAQEALQARTRARMAQGIEGTHAVGEESKPAPSVEHYSGETPTGVKFATDRSTDGIADAIEGATTKLD